MQALPNEVFEVFNISKDVQVTRQVMQSLSINLPKWFEELNEKAQKYYLEEHPKSKLGGLIRQADLKVLDPIRKIKLNPPHKVDALRQAFNNSFNKRKEKAKSYLLDKKDTLNNVYQGFKEGFKEELGDRSKSEIAKKIFTSLVKFTLGAALISAAFATPGAAELFTAVNAFWDQMQGMSESSNQETDEEKADWVLNKVQQFGDWVAQHDPQAFQETMKQMGEA